MRCELLCSSSGEHLSQVYSGFALLVAAGEVRVSLRRLRDYAPGIMGVILRAVVDGRRIVYDVGDHSSTSEEDLQWAELYFKRSYTAGLGEKVHPLGFNYPVYVDGDWRWRRIGWSLRGLGLSNVGDVMTRIARLSGAPTNGGRYSCSISAFESDPSTTGRSVLLLTRLWHQDRDDIHAMNETRVSTIRALRDSFGPEFVGGVAPDAWACSRYPDVVASPEVVKKRNYLKAMKGAAVCVATTGLRDSTGWRFAEYLAAARAIVSEPLRSQVPGDFGDRNYLSFATPEESVAAVGALLDDDGRRLEMQRCNRLYYEEYVRPDALVRRTLAKAASL